MHRSQQTADRFRALSDVSRAITASLSLDKVLRLICTHAARLLDAESVVITERRDGCEGQSGPCLEVVATSADAHVGLGELMSIENSLNGHALTTRQTVVANDVPGDPRADQTLVAKLNVRQSLIAPLILGDEPLGTLAIFNTSVRRDFDQSDADILGALADHAAVAIRNARLFECEVDRLAELDALRATQEDTLKRLQGLISVGMALSSQLSLDEVLQTLVDSAREALQARYAAIGVIDSSGAALARFLFSGLEKTAAKRIGPFPRGGGTLGIMLRDDRTIRLADLRQHPDFAGFPEGHPEMKSLLGVPIRIRGRVFGNLYLTDKLGADDFSSNDEKLAELLAAQAAVAIEKARLYEQRNHFYAIVNHEIKNAVAGVLGWTERLRSITRDSERRISEGASYAFEGAQNLHRLVVDLLDLSRLQARRLELDIKEVDLRALVREVVAAVRPAADRKAIELCVSGLDARAIAETDRARVRQILLNLLSNAVKFSPAGGRVDLELTNSREGWALTVRDTGPGVDPEQRERIFEIYAREPESIAAGSGLGLAISRQLARALGAQLGLLEVDSGAAFRLTLPAQPPRPVGAAS